MTDNNQIQEEQEERKPYQNSYRNTVAKDNPIDEVESEETEEANTEAKATSFVESKKDSKPKHNYKKRYDDLKKHYDEKIGEFKKYKEEQKAAILTKNEIASNIGTIEELESFKDEYPDVYKAMQTISSQHTQEQTQKLESEINALKEKEQRLVEEQARTELLTAHSDFFEIKDTDEFLEWLEDQPSSIANGVLNNSTDSKWAIRVLDLYKSDKGLVKKQTRRSKKSTEAAEFIATKDKVVAEGKNERIWTVSEISRLKPHEFDKFEKEIDAASREGRIKN